MYLKALENELRNISLYNRSSFPADISKAIRNVEERWSEHNSANNKSDPAQHNEKHSFLWRILIAHNW